ncbi:TRAP transporter small permease [Leisingera aquaemixtae]|uniref:TRAP transporter small permease n=1 Tax=Leisingera aquaemixtae TaxID=1396826 RepID=UPI001C98929E|nr:TRAP transporter small permease [Leisingera aquaemixtae]MBY6069347.1 TRAP transporter small permease [Leisingera aquaemixtae]
MTKELLHTDSLDNVLTPEPIMPAGSDAAAPVYRGLGVFYAAEDRVALLMRVMLFGAMISLGLLMAAQVFMRYVISSPFLGIEELAPMLALWIYFIGMAYCTRERDHIEGGVLTLLTQNRKTLLAVRLFGTLACLVTVAVFAWFAWDFAAYNLSLNRKSTYMRLPKYIWDFSMVSGFALMILYLALQFFLEARALLTGQGGD